MWVRFSRSFDYRLPSSTVAYPAGWSGNVPAACADKAVAEGKAVRLKAPRKGEVPDAEPEESEDG